MLKVIAVFLALAWSLAAADVSGKWSGTTTAPGGETTGAFFEFKHSGAQLSGTAGPASDKQWAIQKGKVDGKKLAFEVPMPNGAVMHFDLKVEDGRLEGEMWPERDGQKAEVSTISASRGA